MNLTEKQNQIIIEAESKVFGSLYGEKINIIPVSTVRITDGKVILFNYFMGRTCENIKHNPNVSLVCWSEGEGLQIQGTVEYVSSGEQFKEFQKEIGELHPQRTLNGILVISPNEVFDVSLPKNA